MKKFYCFMKLILCAVPVLFVVYSVYIRYDYFARPEVYAVESAPWYLAVILAAVYAVIAAVIIGIIMLIIKRKMK